MCHRKGLHLHFNLFQIQGAQLPNMNDIDKEQGILNDDVYSQANPCREGFTKADQKHMYRLGKVQELKVCAARE